MKFELNEGEHQLLRNILNDVMQQEGTGGDEYEERLISLHEKICLYWTEESEDKDSFEDLEESARFWGEALKAKIFGVD